MDEGQISQTEVIKKNGLILLFGFISLIISGYTGISILKNKKMKSNHSNKMIAFLCIFNFGVGWYSILFSIEPNDVIAYCKFDVIYITTWNIIYWAVELLVNFFLLIPKLANSKEEWYTIKDKWGRVFHDVHGGGQHQDAYYELQLDVRKTMYKAIIQHYSMF